MTEEQQNRRPAWTRSGLYPFLMDRLPTYRSLCSFLDVKRIADELEVSQEYVYRWFRKGTEGGFMKPEYATKLLKMCAREAAVASREPPTLRDFDPFVYAA